MLLVIARSGFGTKREEAKKLQQRIRQPLLTDVVLQPAPSRVFSVLKAGDTGKSTNTGDGYASIR